MPERLLEQLDNWRGGVNTAAQKDRMPEATVPIAKNTQLYSVWDGHAALGTRGGCKVLNTTALPNAILSQHAYDNSSGQTHLFVEATSGDLKKLSVLGTVTDVVDVVFTTTATTYSWANANNWGFVVNGSDRKKTNGTAVYNFGIAAPGTTHFEDTDLVAGGTGGVLPADTYDVCLTYYNENTGQESGRSTVRSETSTSGQKLTITIPSSTTIADAQVTHIKIHLRRQSTQSIVYEVTEGCTPGPTAGKGWAVSGSDQDIVLDMTSAQIANMILVTPGVNDNQPPPSGVKYIAWHRGRMFAADDTTIYWSEAGEPESFNPLWAEDVNPDSGDPITALVSIDNDLLIFKKFHLFKLTGDDPQTWTLELVSANPDAGCVSPMGWAVVENTVFYWSLFGPRAYSSSTGVVDITTTTILPSISSTTIDWTKVSQIVCAANTYEQYVAWALPAYGSSRNNIILPFHFGARAWMSTKWDPVDAKCLCTIKDGDGRPFIMIGDYDGWIYRLGDGTSDGIPTSITVLSSTVSTSTNNTLTKTSAGWTADVLIGRYVYVYRDSVGFRSYQRRRITDNTTDTLTVDSNWDANPDTTYTYVLGGPHFEISTPWMDAKAPFYKKRYEFIWLECSSPDSNATFECDVYVDHDEDSVAMHKQLTMATGTVGIWDKSLWDFCLFSMEGSVSDRVRIGHVGKNWMAKVSALVPQQRLLLLKVAVQSVPLTKKMERTQ